MADCKWKSKVRPKLLQAIWCQSRALKMIFLVEILLNKVRWYLNPLVPQLITPNQRLRWDISSISALRPRPPRPRPRAGVAKRSVCSGIDEIRWSRGPGVDSRPGFEIFGGRTRAEWLGRRAQLATGTCKARHGQLTTASISHSRDPQVVSHQGTARALFLSRWGA